MPDREGRVAGLLAAGLDALPGCAERRPSHAAVVAQAGRAGERRLGQRRKQRTRCQRVGGAVLDERSPQCPVADAWLVAP